MSTAGIAAEIRRIDELLLRALYFAPKSYWELMRAGKAQTHQVLKTLRSLLEGGLVIYDGDRFVITGAGRGIVLRPPFGRALGAAAAHLRPGCG